MIVVIDYGMGNLRNVRRAIEVLGEKVLLTSSPADVGRGEKIVLPGVGAFGEAVRRIDELGLRDPIVTAARSGTPLLGICLGMQLLFESSEESPGAAGLGVFSGKVLRFRPPQKVPHIGWNDVVRRGRSTLFPQNYEGGVFYFVHSFYIPESPASIATTTYGVQFASAVCEGNAFGVQFHPEKSQAAGMALLQKFLEAPRMREKVD
jgi:glutamine amidotransferase